MNKLSVSLDTNVIIHIYKTGTQEMIFKIFDYVFIDEFIINVELNNHGKEVADSVKKDIDSKKIIIITKTYLKENNMFELYNDYLYEQRYLYDSKDMGEMRAISLAKTLGCLIMFTNDIKDGGPYKTLINCPNEDIIPRQVFEFVFLLYCKKIIDISQFFIIFNDINIKNKLNWQIETQLRKLITRFDIDANPNEKEWINSFIQTYSKKTFKELAHNIYIYNKKLNNQ